MQAMFKSPGAEARQELLDPFLNGGSHLALPEYRRLARSIIGDMSYGLTNQLQAGTPLDPSVTTDLMHEAASSIQLLEQDDRTFEVARIRTAGPDKPYALHISTSSSDMSNPGNLKEFADTAQRYPGYNHAYFASFGNGGTSPLSRSNGERSYAGKSGRYTWEKDGKTVAIPSIVAIYHTLENNGMPVTRIMGTDSAGGNYATALGVAMESGQISHAFFSERSGFVDLSVARIIGGMLLVEKGINEPSNKAMSTDPERLRSPAIAEAADILAKYSQLANRRELDAHRVGLLRKLSSMVTSMNSLRKGQTATDNPLLADANAFHANQPGAHITYALADHDPLYRSPFYADAAARSFISAIRASDADVRAVIVPGTHGWNTHYPTLYHALKKDSITA